MSPKGKHSKHKPPQLRVVFDTSVIYNGSASDLVGQELAKLIKESAFPDLEIQWYLPEVVRHERQHQMQASALRLLPQIGRVERLLGHNLAISEQTLIESVEKAVSLRHDELGFVKLPLDYSKVDWHGVALDAVYRRPPFEDGDAEKGFRDRLILECFAQLVADSPKTTSVCRLVLVSGDALLARATAARTAGSPNSSTVSSVDELRGLINTLVSQVDEAFLAVLKPKAEKLFLVPSDDSSLFYKQRIRENLTAQFAEELNAVPAGLTNRTNGRWRVSGPNFVKKTGPRIQWASRISIPTEASRPAVALASVGSYSFNTDPALTFLSNQGALNVTPTFVSGSMGLKSLGEIVPLSSLAKPMDFTDFASYANPIESASNFATYKGNDIYEVLWSADVTTKRELKRASIDEIRHVDLTWTQVT